MPAYPPPPVMRDLILLIENPVWSLRGEADAIYVGEGATVRGAVQVKHLQPMADAGYVTLDEDEHITVTPAGVEWAGRWCRARMGRELRPATEGG